MTQSDYRMCTMCGTERHIMGDCAECFQRRQFSKLLEQNERLLAVDKNQSINTSNTQSEASDWVGVIVISILILIGINWLTSSSNKKVTTSSPHSFYYIASSGTFKQELVSGVTYSTCDDSIKSGCLTDVQTKQICEEFDGVNTVDTHFRDLNSQTADGRMSSGNKIQLASRSGISVDQSYSFTDLKRGFSNNSCYIKVGITGEYSGKSSTIVKILSWKINQEGKLVAITTMSVPESYSAITTK